MDYLHLALSRPAPGSQSWVAQDASSKRFATIHRHVWADTVAEGQEDAPRRLGTSFTVTVIMAPTDELRERRERLTSGEYERLVLGNILLNPQFLNSELVARLKPEDFSVSSYSLMFRRLQGLVRGGEPLDLGTLEDTLQRHGELERVGGWAALVALGEGLVERPSIDYYAKKLQDYAVKRRLIKELDALAGHICDPTISVVDTVRKLQILSAQYGCESGAETNLAFFTATELMSAEPERVEWVAYPYVAVGAITDVVGKPKLSGKTTFATHIAKAVLDGTCFLGYPTIKSAVVYLTEQSPRTFRVAMQRAGLGAYQDFLVLTHGQTRGQTWPEIARAAVVKAKALAAKLLVVDTLAAFAGLAGDAENNAGDALAAMEPLQRAAEDGLAVLILRHERKSGGQVGESGRGSSAFVGAVDVAMTLRRPEGNARPSLREIHAVSRFDETPDELVVELTDTGYVARGLSHQIELEEACRTMLALLPIKEPDAMTLEQLHGTAKISRSTAQRAVELLEKDGKIQTVGRGVRNNPHRFFRAPDIDVAQTSHIKGQNKFVDSKRVLQSREVLDI